MAKEDLQVNVEINTKTAKRGVDDLNKSLSANTKQTKAIQKELKKLEKEYKSIATAVKKLPAKDVNKLSKEVKKADKATKGLNTQALETEKRLDRVKERTIDTTDAFAALAIVIAGFKGFQPIIRFSGQVVHASQAVLSFQKHTLPFIKVTMRRFELAFMRGKAAVDSFQKTFKLLLPAAREQIRMLKGYHQAQIYTHKLNQQLAISFRYLSSSASYVNRSLRELNGYIAATSEGWTRVTRVFRSMGKSLTSTAGIVGKFRREWFGTFGASSAGAAQINKWQKLMLELRYAGELAGNKIRTVFASIAPVMKTLVKDTGAFLVAFGKKSAVKIFETLKVAIMGLGPALLNARARFNELRKVGLAKFGAQSAKAAIEAGKFSGKLYKMGVDAGVLEKGFFGAIESMSGLGIAFLGVGTLLKKTDNALLDFIGTVVQFVGILNISLAGAMSVLLGVIGGVMIAIGDKLMKVMDSWEKKFVKLQKITQAFEFTLRGFGRTMGEEAIGSLEKWNVVIEDLTATTAFSAGEIQKSIKLLVAEGAQLHMTAEQNAKILKRAADIAALTGAELAEVSLAIAKGLAGNSSALQTYGIFVDQASLQHSKLAKKQGLVVANLDKYQKAQLTMNVIMEQTIPLIGAAANGLDTVSGATKQYEQTLDTLLAKLGSQNIVFTKLIQLKTGVVQALLALPTPIIDAVSLFVDFAGIALKITGIFISLSLTIYSLITVFHLLSYAVKQYVFVQSALSVFINALRVNMGLMAVEITTLGGAFKALSQTFIPGVISAKTALLGLVSELTLKLRTFVAAMLFTRAGWITMAKGALAATAAMLRFTVSLLTNPLFLAASTIIGSIILLSKAIGELREEISFLRPEMDKAGQATKDTAEQVSTLLSWTVKVGRVLINTAKIVVLGWLEIYKVVQLAIVGYKKLWYATKGLFTDTSKEMAALDKESKNLVKDLHELNRGVIRALDNKPIKEFNKELAKTEKKMKALARATRGFSEHLQLSGGAQKNLQIAVLGDEIDRANKKFEEANKTLNNLSNIGVFKVGTELIMPTTENLAKFAEGTLLSKEGKKVKVAPALAGEAMIQKAAIEREQARLELVKLRRNAMKGVNQALKEQNIMALEAAGRELEAIRVRGKAQLQALRERMGGQNKIAQLRGEELKRFQQLEAAIKTSTWTALVEKNKALEEEAARKSKEQLDLVRARRTEFTNLHKEVLEASGNQEAIGRMQLGLRIQEINALEESLKTQKEFTDEAGNLKKEYATVVSDARELAGTKFEDFLDSQRFAAKLAAAIEQISPDTFGGAFAKGLLEYGLKTFTALEDFANSIDKALPKVKEAFSGLSLDKGFMGNLGEAKKGFGKLFEGVDWENVGVEIGGFLSKSFVKGADFLTKLFDPETINKLADFLEKFLQELPDQLIKAFNRLDGILTKFIEKFPEVIQSLLDVVPQLIQSVLSKIPALIDAVAKGLGTLFDKLPAIVTMIVEAMPAIVRQIMDVLPELILKLFDALGKSIAQIIKQLPAILISVIEGLPAVIEAVYEGFIAAAGDIAAAFIDFLLGGGLERIFSAILKAIPRIVWAFVNGVAKGLKRAMSSIFNGIEPPEALTSLPEKFNEGFKKLAKQATNEASNLFKVLDLEDAAKGLGGAGPGSQMMEQTIQVGQYISGLWQMFLDALKRVWMWIWETILEPVVRALDKVWRWVYEYVVKPLLYGLRAVFQWVKTNVVDRLMNAGYAIWEGLKAGLETIGTYGFKLWEGFKAAIDAGGGVFGDLGTQIWKGFEGAFDGGAITGLLDDLNPENLFKKIFRTRGAWGKGKVEKALKIDVPFMKFAQGGLVPGAAPVPGDSPLNDKILAMLSPGEVVIPRSVLKEPVLAKLVEMVMKGQVDIKRFFGGGTVGKIVKGDTSGAVSDVQNVSFEQAIKEGENVADLVKNLSPEELWKQVKKKVYSAISKMFSENSFHTGGLVPAFAFGGTVPATLESGEFVINRQAVQSLGLGTLNQVNRGQTPVNQEFNFEIRMDVRSDNLPDESFVRQRMIPAMKRELKDASMRGEFLMSSKGIRTT